MKVILKDGSILKPPEKKSKTKVEKTRMKPKGKNRSFRISETQIRAAVEEARKTGKPVELTHLPVPGMKLIAYPSGLVKWRHRWTDANGKKQICTIGSVEKYTVTEVEDIVRERKRWIERGLDPDTGADPNCPTVDEFFNTHFMTRARMKYKNLPDLLSRYRKWIKPKLGHLKITELTRATIAMFHCEVMEKKSGITANRCLSGTASILKLGVEFGLIEDNPCRGIQKFPEGDGRDRVLNDEEIVQFLKAVGGRIDEPSVQAISLLFSTGKRRSEILSARWSLIDLDARRLNPSHYEKWTD